MPLSFCCLIYTIYLLCVALMIICNIVTFIRLFTGKQCTTNTIETLPSCPDNFGLNTYLHENSQSGNASTSYDTPSCSQLGTSYNLLYMLLIIIVIM